MTTSAQTISKRTGKMDAVKKDAVLKRIYEMGVRMEHDFTEVKYRSPSRLKRIAREKGWDKYEQKYRQKNS